MKAITLFTSLLAVAMLLAGCAGTPAYSSPVPVQTSGSLSAIPSGFEEPSSGDNPVLAQIAASYSAQDFTAGKVPDEDIAAMLLGAARAPSAKNEQPWHFTVVKNDARIQALYQNAQPGNIAVILSGKQETVAGMTDFDCGLAAGYLQLAAESMGYGARILISPVAAVKQQQEQYGIPSGYDVITVTIIGPVDNPADAAASATRRNPLNEMVNLITT